MEKVHTEKNKENKKTYAFTENKNGYILEIKTENQSVRIILNFSKDIPNQNELSDENEKKEPISGFA